MARSSGMLVCGLLLGAGAALACGNGQKDAGSNLVSFAGSACKKEAPAGTTEQALVTGVSGEALAGLQCIAWERVGTDGLKVDLVNFEGACGAQWSGGASVNADGSLALRLDNPECRVASCGWCIYDWSFEVRGIGVGSSLPVGIGIDTCPGQQEIRTYQATLPLASSPQGLLCRYANYNALGDMAGPTNTCGTLNMPCLGTGSCSSTVTSPSCNAGLVCETNGTADQWVCLGPCVTDADCPAGGALSCQAGFCRPAQTW